MATQLKKDAAVNQRIQLMKQRLDERDATATTTATKDEWRKTIEQSLTPTLHALYQKRRSTSTCIVIDMDAFYINCELLTKPHLTQVPACVGINLITTSNYPARRYGVRSAMAGWIDDTLVSELSGGKETLVHVKSNFELYREKSEVVRRVLSVYDPQGVRAYSLDEVYLDLGRYLEMYLVRGWGHERILEALQKGDGGGDDDAADVACEHTNSTNVNGSQNIYDVDEDDATDNDDNNNNNDFETNKSKSAHLNRLSRLPPQLLIDATTTIVHQMRTAVQNATGGLTCSAGIASNFLLAKIASDANKPNGQCLVGSTEVAIREFIDDLPVRKVPGIGRVTSKILDAFDIGTVRRLYEERAVVNFLFTPVLAVFLLRASVGWSDASNPIDAGGDDGSSGSGDAAQKGISIERTFRAGGSWTEINSKLEEIAWNLSQSMKTKDIWAKTITLKVKLHTFDVLSKSKSMPKGVYLHTAQDMIPVLAQMLADLKGTYHKGGASGDGKIFSLRLLGIRCSNFRGKEDKLDASRQPRIMSFLTPAKGQSKEVDVKSVVLTTPADEDEDKDENVINSAEGIDEIEEGDENLRTGDDTGKKKCALQMQDKIKHIPPDSDEAEVHHSDLSDTRVRAHGEISSMHGGSDVPLSSIMQEKEEEKVDVQQIIPRCPICLIALSSQGDNDSINRHIDSCLNSGTVREIAHQESVIAAQGRLRKKTRSLTDFFS